MAYVRASRQPQANGEVWVEGILNIDPDVRGLGVEALLVEHALRRAGKIIEEAGRDATTRLIVYVTGRDEDQRLILETRGLRRVRRSAQLMRTVLDDIPDVPIPTGFEVRPISDHDQVMHRRVFDADAHAFADSYGQQAKSEAEFDEFIHMPTFDPTLWRVAFRGDDIAGQVLSYMGERAPDGSRSGWIALVAVQPEYRRLGLARALLAASLRAVRDNGATSAALGVDTQNPNQALTLYESLGFRIVSETYEYELGPFPPGVTPDLGGRVPQ